VCQIGAIANNVQQWMPTVKEGYAFVKKTGLM